jgi:hypothetical protein
VHFPWRVSGKRIVGGTIVKSRIIIVSLLVLSVPAWAEGRALKHPHHQTAALKQAAKTPKDAKERKPFSFQSIDAQYRGG